MKKPDEDVGGAVTAVAGAAKLELFDPENVRALNGVRVFDVGQGDCIGLLDQRNRVFCYVDYGGLADHPDAANPIATAGRMPVGYRGGCASVVLTHWDKDHYWSANKKNPAARDGEWLVPRQMASPTAVRFAAELEHAKCWPESRKGPVRLGIGASWDIEIRKCDAFVKNALNENRNHTGLAISLLQWRDSAVELCILLPGDCPFHRIPNPPPGKMRGLVAYHHGAHEGWTAKTTQAIANVHTKYEMVYSFGENDYGHPDRDNYAPHWDARSRATCEAREEGKQSFDIRWK